MRFVFQLLDTNPDYFENKLFLRTILGGDLFADVSILAYGGIPGDLFIAHQNSCGLIRPGLIQSEPGLP